MYRLICYSCEVRNFFEDREEAQATFNDHAEEQHDVVLRRLKYEIPDQDGVRVDGEEPEEPADGQTKNTDTESVGE